MKTNEMKLWTRFLCLGYFILFMIFVKLLMSGPEDEFKFDIEIPSKHFFNCSNINDIQYSGRVGSGYSKQAYMGYYRSQYVVVKTTSSMSRDVQVCLRRLRTQNKKLNIKESNEKLLWQCVLLPHMKLLKEILFMEQLHHPNIVPLLGYCVRNEQPGESRASLQDNGAVAVYEYGEDFTIGAIRRLPVYRRLVVCIELADLMHYLQFSPLGSLLFADFKSSHFILVRHHVMLLDFDDVNNVEPRCGKADDIVIKAGNSSDDEADAARDAVDTPPESCRYGVACHHGQCVGVNALHNLKRTVAFFIEPLVKSMEHASGQFSSAFKSDYASVVTYLSDINSAMKGGSNSEPLSSGSTSPPSALELRTRLEKLQSDLLFRYSGRETTTTPASGPL